MFTLTIPTLLFLGASFAFLLFNAIKIKRRPLPPGPRQSSPFGGKPQSNQPPWKTYATWTKVFGPVIRLPTLGRHIIVLNSTDAAIDLLDKRRNFACKPRWPMAELLGRQHNVGFQYYGERLKKSRKFLHNSLSMRVVTSRWGNLLDAHSRLFLSNLLESPENFHTDVHRNVESFITFLAYGREPKEEYIHLAKEVMAQTSIALQPGRWLVNFIPILAYVPAWAPGAGFQRWASDAKELFFTLTRTPFNQVKADMADGVAESSFVRSSLESLGDDYGTAEDQGIIMSTAGSLFSAGTETLISSVLTFFLLMARHPEVQDRAYQEICSVIDKNRLPGSEYIDSLPYVNAIIQEMHRFNPAIPLVTHAPMEEDDYMGYRIPKKAWMMANVWAMLHNEEDYPEPEKFRPERFLPSEGPAPRDPRTLVFGFGRRTCPGMHLANTLVYLTVIRVLTLFKIDPEIGPDGKASPPPLEFATGLVPTPKPFRCVITPRPGAAELIASAGSA